MPMFGSSKTLTSTSFRRTARDTNQIDTVSTALAIRQIVTKMRAIHTHRLAVGEHSDVLPIHLVIAKTRPAMGSTLFHEVLHRTPTGGSKERFARVGIIVGNGMRFRCVIGIFHKFGKGLEVSGMLRIMSIVITDSIGEVSIARPAKVALDGHIARAVSLRRHDGFASHDCGGWVNLVSLR